MTTIDETQVRSVAAKIGSVRTVEGGGFVVRRPFPTPNLSMFDPFLLLDEMGPAEYGPGEGVGAPDHPHRGFETVTYMLDGSFQHRDSTGTSGILTPGAVQWMTAGAGIVHSEMPSDEIMEKGGRVHGFQLWVNLPASEKMVKPRYQEFPADGVPTATSEQGVWVRVIAGEALGVDAVIDTHTPITYLHFVLQPGASHVQRMPSEYNSFAYVASGRGRFGTGPVLPHANGDASPVLPRAKGESTPVLPLSKGELEGVPDPVLPFDKGDSSPVLPLSKGELEGVSDEDAVEGDFVAFERDGGRVRMTNTGDEPLSVLLLGGLPLNEPVARYGPFVMNTKDEIIKAVEDYRAGRMGTIKATTG